MKMVLLVAITMLVIVGLAKEHPECKLYFTDYCQHFKYPSQIHDVITEDGYILRLFRIQKKGTTIQDGLKPIYLQHGLLDSSDTWIINDEDKAPGFMLANKGYDVWFGNSRGNKHSRRHTHLNPDKGAQFWEFTFQNMSDYDLPASLKYVNNKTGQKPHYLGHSQGTIIMHVALSKRNSAVEDYFDKFFGFGPVVYTKYMTSPLMSLLRSSHLLEWYKIRHIHQFMPSFGWFMSDVGRLFCSDFPKVCGDLMKYIMDADPSLDNYDRYDVLVGHAPSGTSVTNMEHWKQITDSGKFQAFDYGSVKVNQAHYGQPYPPSWNITNIRKPLRWFGGSSDELADLTDLNYAWSILDPSVKQFKEIYAAGHCTFMWGKYVNPWMNDLYKLLANKQIGKQYPLLKTIKRWGSKE